MTGRTIRDAVVFECVGVPGMIQQLIERAPPTATVIVVGVCMESDTIEPSLAINKQLGLKFVLGYTPEEFAATLHAIAEGEREVTPLLSATVGRSGVKEAFASLSSAVARPSGSATSSTRLAFGAQTRAWAPPGSSSTPMGQRRLTVACTCSTGGIAAEIFTAMSPW